MIHIVMSHRSDLRKFIHAHSKLGQMFTNLDAGHFSSDGFKLAPVFHGGIGLHIPGILLCGAAPHEENDASLGFAFSGGRAFASLKQLGQSQPQKGKRPCAQKFPPTRIHLFSLPLFQISHHSFEEDRPKAFYTHIIILQNEHLDGQKLSWVPIIAI